MDGLVRTDDDLPVWEFVLDLALQNGDFAGKDQRTVLDFRFDLMLLDELGNGAGREFSGRPLTSGQVTASVGDQVTGTPERSISWTRRSM